MIDAGVALWKGSKDTGDKMLALHEKRRRVQSDLDALRVREIQAEKVRSGH